MAISIGSIKATLSADSSGFTKAMGLAKGGLAGFAGAAAKAVTAAAAVGAAVTAASVKIAGDFESSLVSAGAKANATEMQLQQMKQAALEASGASEFSAKGAADAMGFLAQAGFDVQEQMSALPGVLNLASAGELELAEAAEIASSTVRGFGKDVDDLAEVNDLLVKAANSSNTSVSQLGQAFSFAAPAASAAGVSIQETTSIISTLSNNAIQSGRAGRGFNQIMRQMVKVSDELGAGVTNASIQSEGFTASLNRLADAGLTAQNAGEHFSAEAGLVAKTLLNAGIPAIEQMTDTLNEAGGAAESVAAKKIDTLNGAMNVLSGNVQNVATKYGDAFLPVLSRVAEATSTLVDSLVKNDKLWREVASTVVDATEIFAQGIRAIAFTRDAIGILTLGVKGLIAPIRLLMAAYESWTIVMESSKKGYDAAMEGLDRAKKNFSETRTSITMDMQKTADSMDSFRGSAFKVAEGLDGIAASARGATDGVSSLQDQLARDMKKIGTEGVVADRGTGVTEGVFSRTPDEIRKEKQRREGGGGGGGGRGGGSAGGSQQADEREKFDLAAATNREAQKIAAQQANEKARQQTHINALVKEGNERAAERARNQKRAADRRRQINNAERDFAVAAERAFRARVKQAEAEREATVELIGFAQSATSELTGLAGAIAKAGGASSKAQSAIGGVGDLLGQGLGVAGNLASGNILGAITGGIGAITSGVGLAGELFGMGGKSKGGSKKDRPQIRDLGDILGERIAEHLNEADLRPIVIEFDGRGAITDQQTISRVFEQIEGEAQNRGLEAFSR